MRSSRAFIVLLVFLVLGAARVHADTINISVGGGTLKFVANPGGGQRVTFTGLQLFTSDSSANTPLTISPGSGNFMFTSVSGGQGLFAPLNGATFSMGTTSSGIASGSISSIQIVGSSAGSTATTFTIQLVFSNMSFQQCSVAGCVNSDLLRQFAGATTSTVTLNFAMPNSTATSLEQLLAMKGAHNTPLSGDLEATPEPATLALFGTGLLIYGLRLSRKRKHEGKE